MYPSFKPTLLILFFLFILLPCRSQDVSWKDRLYIEAAPHYGYVIPHHPYIAYFINEHVKGYEINIGIHTSGTKVWQQYFKYPNIGIGYYHSGLGNQEVFGSINGLYYYVDRMYRNPDRKFNFGNRFSIGMAYVTKKHDQKNDNYNMAIGSNLNVYLHYSLEIAYKISPSVTTKIGAGLTHTSNGNYREPNKGLNIFTGNASIQYSFHAYQHGLQKIIPVDDSNVPRNQFIVTGGLGRKQISMFDSKIYTPLFLSMEYGRRINSSVWLGPVICFYHDNSINKDLELLGDSAVNNNTKIRISTHISAEINMGRMSFVFQPGIYIKNSYSKSGIINNRLGCRFNINDKLLASVMIKAHWPAIADFIEWGISYRWNK